LKGSRIGSDLNNVRESIPAEAATETPRKSAALQLNIKLRIRRTRRVAEAKVGIE
jgi:hypothetical protein